MVRRQTFCSCKVGRCHGRLGLEPLPPALCLGNGNHELLSDRTRSSVLSGLKNEPNG